MSVVLQHQHTRRGEVISPDPAIAASNFEPGSPRDTCC